MGGIVSSVGDAFGKVIDNPVPALMAYGTGNPAALAAYAAPSGSNTTQGLLSAAGGYLQNQSNVAGNQTAAQASQFRPVGITNTFGTSNFQVDPTTGQMISAGYSLSPELQAYQNAIMGNNRQSLNDVTTLQNLGRGYLAQSPQQAAQQWMTNQQALLQPSRDMESARLANQLQQTGRTGVSVAQGGGLSMANPEQQALANARAMQDLQLAAQAQQAGQQQTAFGQGLLSSAYQPFSAGLSAAGVVEQLGQQPFGLSSELAGRSSSAGQKSADYLKSAGQTNSLASLLTGAGTNTALGQGISSLFGGIVPSYTAGAGAPGYDWSGLGSVDTSAWM